MIVQIYFFSLKHWNLCHYRKYLLSIVRQKSLATDATNYSHSLYSEKLGNNPYENTSHRRGVFEEEN